MRTRFSLPHALNASFLDMAVMLTGENSSIQIRRQLTVRTLFILVAGIVGYLLLIMQTPLGKGGIIGIAIWTIGYLWLLYLLCVPTESKQVGLNQLMPMVRYLQKENRWVGTSTVSNADRVRDLVGIDGISRSSQMVYYSTGEVGFVVEVIGNASILMFESDQNMVLEGTRNFYRKITPNVELIFDTATEGQRVERQVATVMSRRDNLRAKSPELRKLLDTEANILLNHVGMEFKSLHQYMVVRATNESALREFDQWLGAQIANGSGFLTDYRILNYDDTFDYFKRLYSANDSSKR